MKKQAGILTFKIFFLIIMTDVFESIAEIFFKKAALITGINNITFDSFFKFALSIVSIPSLWIGVFFYCLNFIIWIIVLSRIDLSVAFPVGSTTYIIVPVLSIIFLNEQINALRWAGIIFIIIGIYFVSKSTQFTAKHL